MRSFKSIVGGKDLGCLVSFGSAALSIPGVSVAKVFGKLRNLPFTYCTSPVAVYDSKFKILKSNQISFLSHNLLTVWLFCIIYQNQYFYCFLLSSHFIIVRHQSTNNSQQKSSVLDYWCLKSFYLYKWLSDEVEICFWT